MDPRRFGLNEDELRQLGFDLRSRPGRQADDSGSGTSVGTGTKGEEPRRRRLSRDTRAWIATLLVLVGVGWASGLERRLPRAAPATAPDTTFASARALAQLADVTRRPRPTGSPELERVRTQIVGRLRSMGLEPELQTTTSFQRDHDRVRAATVRNVVARAPGSAPTGAILLTAHYDSAPLSPGAADDGIGVATVLETVRAVLAGPQLRNDLIILLTEGDAIGLPGSRAFALRHPWVDDVAAVLTVDAHGATGPAIMFESGGGSHAASDALSAIEPVPFAMSSGHSLRARASEPVLSDRLARPGVDVYNLAVVGGAAWRGQQRDDLTRVSERSLQDAGRQTLSLTKELGGRDFSDDRSNGDVVYLSLPWVDLVTYSATWILPATGGLALLWLLVFAALKLRRPSWVGVCAGLGAAAATVVASAAAARTLRDLAAPMHPEYGALTVAFFEDSFFSAAAAGIAVAAAAILYSAARRWSRIDERVFGGLLVPLGFCTWLTLRDPASAPALQLPLVSALLAGGLVVVARPFQTRRWWTWAVLLSLSALTLVTAVPALQLLAQLSSFRSAGLIGASMGLGAVLFWPLLEELVTPRPWRTPLVAMLAAAGFVVATLPVFRSADDHPTPTALLYLADAPQFGSAISSRASAVDDPQRAVRSMRGRWLTVPGSGEAWARSWAGEPATGSTDPGLLMLGVDSLYEIIGTAPVSELAPPRVTSVLVAIDGGRRTVELALESGLGGEMLGVRLPDGSKSAITGVGDARWDVGASPVHSVEHWGTPPAPGVRVTLDVDPAVSQLSLVVVEHHLRPRELIGDYFFQRPDSLLANAALESDRAIQRTILRVPLEEPRDFSLPRDAVELLAEFSDGGRKRP